MSRLLVSSQVAAALNVPGHRWSECSASVHTLLADDWMLNLEVHIPDVLAAGASANTKIENLCTRAVTPYLVGVQVLIYAGDRDFICNVEGNQRWVRGCDLLCPSFDLSHINAGGRDVVGWCLRIRGRPARGLGR